MLEMETTMKKYKALGNQYPKYMEVMAYPGLVGAVCVGNEATIDILKPFTDEDTFSDIVSTFTPE